MTDTLVSTHKLRLKDKHARELNRQARVVNFVWNYCNETQQKAARARRRWLSGFDLCKLTSGSSKELDLHAHTIQGVCKQYAKSRDQHKRPWLRFRDASLWAGCLSMRVMLLFATKFSAFAASSIKRCTGVMA